jgi:hypothetical protein
MSNTIFPYPTVRQTVLLEVTEAKLDGEPLDEQAFRSKDRLVYLFGHFRQEWSEAILSVTCSLPAEVLDRFENRHGAVGMQAIAHCRPTNAREGFSLERSRREPGRWKGTLTLTRDGFRGRVTLEANATATVHDIDYRLVAASEEWWVYFDPVASFRINGALPVRWCRFKDEEAPAIAKQFSDSAYVVNLDDFMPTILLNADFEGLDLLLNDKKSRSAVEQALHDGQRMAIGRGVWMARIQDSVAAVRTDELEEGEDPTWPLSVCEFARHWRGGKRSSKWQSCAIQTNCRSSPLANEMSTSLSGPTRRRCWLKLRTDALNGQLVGEPRRTTTICRCRAKSR